MPTLFDPIQLGAIHAPNRILMAPLTRGRATRDHVPTPLMADYYAQRASAGLIISEATRDQQPGTRLALCARSLVGRTNRGLEAGDASGPRRGRANHRADLAYGPGRP